MNRLTRGKGNVVSQLCRFADLGVATRKPLPPPLMESAELDEVPLDDAADDRIAD
jgi:hypothetical protein